MNSNQSIKTQMWITLLLVSTLSIAQPSNQKSDISQVRETLNKYLNGTANGDPDLLREAFHPDFNLYTVNPDGSLWIRSGEKYISAFKKGVKSSRTGKIVNIDIENTVATARIDLTMNGKAYVDYFLLAKYEGKWRIIQKSYAIKAE